MENGAWGPDQCFKPAKGIRNSALEVGDLEVWSCFGMIRERGQQGTEAAMEKDYSVRMGFVDDYICAICDEGGDLICCDGDCGRSFHPTKPTGEASHCDTLGLSEEQLELPEFLCENCASKKHQCFVCGELGSSDQGGGEQVIIQCNKRGCKRFYHPECLPLDINNLPGDSCPMHECYSCKKKHATSKGNKTTGKTKGKGTCRKKHATLEGNKTIGKSKGRGTWGMDLVLCRRCPKAFHRKCLPRKINGGEGEIKRIWETAGGTVFYCRDHEMVENLRSAKRNHIKFREEKPKGATENQSVEDGNK
ncbi:protein ENHANCED DOWNY MILDEW 2 isoform X2 [Triticum aestivum]|nr:protein ENHANCED DOWNY MILDEW 2-like isoform X2 [Triticum aestivum]